MESKKINQLATNVSPQTSDLTIIGDPTTGVSKKITLLQIANLFATTGTVTSVGVTETGDALTITGSPITTAGTINIGFAGAATQYVRGDGALADFPTSTGGGSSVSYYLNSSVSQGTIGGVAYRQLSKTPIAGAGTDITISANGYVASYITDSNDPALLEVPAGNFNCEFYFSVNSNNHNPYVYAELYKYDGTTFTLLGSSQTIPEYLTNGTTLSAYYFAMPIAVASLTITDRLAIRIYVNVDTRTVTLHTENSHLCQVVTTFSKGLTTLNSLTRQTQFFATGTSGTDFAISSTLATHTFNLPVASATNTGKLSSTDWSTFNGKYNLPSLTSGSVLFSNGTTIAQNNANFFWDNTNNRLGIGTASPSAGVTVYSTTAATQFKAAGTAPAFTFSDTLVSSTYAAVFGLATSANHFITGTATGDMAIANQSTTAGAIVFGTGTTEKMRMTSAGTFSIGNTNSTYKLDVTGTVRFTGELTGSSAVFSSTVRPSSSLLADLGSSSFRWNDIYGFTLNLSSSVTALSIIKSGGTSSQFLKADGSVDTTAYGTGSVTSVAALTLGTSGTDLSSTVANGTTTPVITLNVPTASATNRGALSSADWTTFNNKQSALTNPVTGTGTTNYISKFTGASTIGNSLIFDNGTNVGIGNTNTSYTLDVSGTGRFTSGVAIGAGTQAINADAELTLRDGVAFVGLDFKSARTSGSIGGLRFFNTSSDSDPASQMLVETDGKFVFYNGTLGAQARMTITSAGNVGIGTTSPSAKLTILRSGSSLTTLGQSRFLDITDDYGAANSRTEIGFGYTSQGTTTNIPAVIGYLQTSTASYTKGDLYFATRDVTTDTALTERMRITSAGNVGIGTSSPSTAGGAYTGLDIRGSGGGSIYLGTAATAFGLLYADSGGYNIQSGNVPIIFYPNGTERMRINSNGRVGIGGTAGTNALLHVFGDVAIGDQQSGGDIRLYVSGSSSTKIPGLFNNTNGGSGGETIVLFQRGGTTVGSISSTNALTSYNVTSDYRLKQDLKDFDGLNIISKIKTYDYQWKMDNSRMYGVVAHELQEVLPYAVHGEKDAKEMQGVDYSKLVPVLVKAIQELSKQNEELSNRLIKLENK